ncbi:hypothetical protein QVD99_006801 [Batrachochytrium dendrobatidis]|nr:hypothetical protein QVD99_006801 [Batrachochytrium dendrobatidis]
MSECTNSHSAQQQQQHSQQNLVAEAGTKEHPIRNNFEKDFVILHTSPPSTVGNVYDAHYYRSNGIDQEYHAQVIQQPAYTRCSGLSNNGAITCPIEPCISVQLHGVAMSGSSENQTDVGIPDIDCLIAQAYLTCSNGTSDLNYYSRTMARTYSTAMDHSKLQNDDEFKSFIQNTSVTVANNARTPLIHSDATQRVTCQDEADQAHLGFYSQDVDHHTSPHSPPCIVDDTTYLPDTDYPQSQVPVDFASHTTPPNTIQSISDKSEWRDITSHVLVNRSVQAQIPTLCGNQTAAADIATDLDNNRGVFFFFPDLGIRIPGKFKIRIIISKIQLEWVRVV